MDFFARVKRTPEAIAILFNRNRMPASYRAQMRDEIARWQAALLSEGLASGDRVAVMLRNCPQWVMFDQAAHSLGLVVVPLYTVDRPDSVAFIVNDSGAKVLLFETSEQWQALRSVRDKWAVCRDLSGSTILPMRRGAFETCRLPLAASFQLLLLSAPSSWPPSFIPPAPQANPGVMLSHNILSNAYTL
jgi:long-subunit acyl-CoA synthetase (AMP-forming)